MTRTSQVLGATLLLASLLVITLTGASYPAALSQKQAVQTVVHYGKTDNKASATYNIGLQNAVEEGIEARQDDSNFSLLSQAQAAAITAGTTPSTANLRVYLTGSSKTPAEFLATIPELATSGTDPSPAYTWYGVFRKDSKKAAWRLDFGAAILATNLPGSVTMTSGKAQIHSAAPNSGLVALVKYLTTGQGNVAPSPNANSWYATDQQVASSDANSGIAVGLKFTVDRSPVTSIEVSGGSLEFGGIDEMSTERALSSVQCVAANPSNTSEYLTLVPAGIQYQQIQVDTLIQVSLFVPANLSQPVQLLSLQAQLMSANTPPCPAS
ncbi:MAG: hypothetical protein WBA31_05975 [Candidatus Dormiibacterota bacterium]